MIYYCLLLIAITEAGVSLMFYACLKRQGYLITLMHVLWNTIRYFIFSFFLYGISFLMIRDLIACMKLIFQNKLIEGGQEVMFFHNCLLTDKTKILDETIRISINKFFSIYKELEDELKVKFDDFCVSPECINLNNTINAGTLGSFDCGFLKSELQHLYQTLYDASVESRILSALSLCSAFLGAISIYFYLLVMHHYNNELFFDTGKSIFTGFDGFGVGYKKKNLHQDPAYKKRKLRAEIELTSKNDEDSP